MNYNYGCCGYDCGPDAVDEKDKDALLKEQEAILIAKLETIKHMRKKLSKVDSDSKSK